MTDKKKHQKSLCYVLIFCSLILALSGCMYSEEPMPEIIYSPSLESTPIQRTIIRPQQPEQSLDNVPIDWIPPSFVEKVWTAIVIHHSATANGNAAIFNRWHIEHNGWEGIGYDFVIGNGTDSGDGQVEVTFRWTRQIAGAHCGGTPDNWANEEGIGICLVGDFNITAPTTQQIQSLVRLTRFLQRRYGIPTNRIYGHGTTPGARATDCPGRNFPMSQFKSMLGS